MMREEEEKEKHTRVHIHFLQFCNLELEIGDYLKKKKMKYTCTLFLNISEL